MTHRKRTTAFALAGAVALASGAYALGGQTDGNAAAAPDERGPARVHFGAGPPGESLADRLGVEARELREALADVRGDLDRPREPFDDFAADLADELGVGEARVEAALERLGLDEDEVEDALGDGPPFIGPPPHRP